MKKHKAKADRQEDKQEKGASSQDAGTQDAEAVLKAGYRKIEELFDAFDNAETQQAQAQAAKNLCAELISHMTLKEQVFFPACRLQGLDEETLEIAQIHLDGMKLIVADLMHDRPDAPYYRSKVKVLKQKFTDQTEKEEASDGLLAQAKEKGADMDELARELQQRQQELTERSETQSPQTPALRALMSSETQQHSQRKDERMNKQYRGQGQGRYYRDEDDRYGSRSQQSYGSENYGSQRYGSRGSQYGEHDYRSQNHDRSEYGRGEQRYGEDHGRGSQNYGSQRYGQDYGQQDYGQRGGQQRYRQGTQNYGGGIGYQGDYPERYAQRYRPDYEGEYSQNGRRRQSGSDYERGYAQRGRSNRDYEGDYGTSGSSRSYEDNGRYAGDFGSSDQGYGHPRQQRGYSGQRYGRNEDSDMQSRSRSRYGEDDDDRDMPIW